MKRCRNTNLIFISLILLLSTLLFRNVTEPFDEMSATKAAEVLAAAATAAHTAYDGDGKDDGGAVGAADRAQSAYNAALDRFTANPTQANGVALSNAQAINVAAKKAKEDAFIAAETADAAAQAAIESIPVSTPPPPTVSAELESAAMSAAYPVEALSDSTKTYIGIGIGVVLLYILYKVLVW